VTEGDVDALQQAATEITKIDHMLVQRESKTGYDQAREAGKALQDQGQAIAEELRLFRKFLDNEGDV
jgi:GTP cyclohydrolase III